MQRLKNYDYIFVASKEAKIGTQNMSKNFVSTPKIYETGYYKLDYFLRNKEHIKNKKIIYLIAPTGINGFSKLTMVKDLIKIIEKNFFRNKV